MKQLTDAYQKLSTHKKNLLQILALSNNETFINHYYVRIFKHAAFLSEGGQKYNESILEDDFVYLSSLGLMLNKFKASIVNTEFSFFLILEATKNPELKTYIGAIRAVFPMGSNLNIYTIGYYYFIFKREIIYSIILQDIESFQSLFSFLAVIPDYISSSYYFASSFVTKTKILNNLSIEFVCSYFKFFHNYDIFYLNSIDYYIEKIESIIDNDTDIIIKRLLADAYLLQGNIEAAEKIIELMKGDNFAITYQASIQFMNGNYAKAVELFDVALKTYRKDTGSRNDYFPNFIGIFNILAMLNQNVESSKIIASAKKTYWTVIYKCIEAVIANFQSNFLHRDRLFYETQIHPFYSTDLFILFYCYSRFYCSLQLSDDEETKLYDFVVKANSCGSTFFSVQAARLLLKTKKQPKNIESTCMSIIEKSKINTDLTLLIAKKEKWELVLDSLSKFSTPGTKGTVQNKERVAWLVSVEQMSIVPILQSVTKTGVWSKGRNIALKRINAKEINCMTEHDLSVAKALRVERGYYGSDGYFFDWNQAVSALVGHPHVYLYNKPNVRIEFEKASPELIVNQTNHAYCIEFSVDCSTRGVIIRKSTLTSYKVIEITDTHTALFNVFGGNKISIPLHAKDVIAKAIANLTSVLTIHSDLQIDDEDMLTVETDSRIYVQLLPHNDSIKAELYVKPFKNTLPYLKPAKGRVNMLSELDGKKIRTVRNLDQELINANKVYNASSELKTMNDLYDVYIAEDILHALTLLSELEAIKNEIVIEWPQGEKIKFIKLVSYDDLAMKINHKNDWFEISGQVKINESLTIELFDFITKIKDQNVNFVELSDGEFISLSDRFRKHLADLDAFSYKNKKSLTIHPLASQAISGLTDNTKNLKVDKVWTDHKKRMEKALDIKVEVPSTLDAELRSYQVEGYNWLSRLAAWGVGACLADDMGLGKTIQSIAVLLQRAPNGQALIIAPTSVARNWISEITKFAPTLNPIFFNTSNRNEILKELKPYDVLITTYGLLQTEEKALTDINWHTIVLDEAHAIKNHNTKTSKAAMQLKADFRIITTGTPIQNHLGELWNLFNFINRGLLGSSESFSQRFVTTEDPDARKKLKKLINPFILRRSKNQVLDELPEKTEITIEVELTEEEVAIYEAFRRNALKKLESDERPDAQKQLQILAEISNLRQLCCSPKLVMDDSLIKSSKINVFNELLREIIDGGHKVLVFSQFVKFLTIIKDELQAADIKYQYLDGSTPIATREKSIKEFQSGQGDVFLISLRAGGLGLNLTAADYVIHLDPWWNPAVEDQASDRAHRIGQTRPVTVYRLVAKGLIEEKILKMHKSKRNLADNILDGTDVAGKMSAAELLDLIKFV